MGSAVEWKNFFNEVEENFPDKEEITLFLKELLEGRRIDYRLAVLQKTNIKPLLGSFLRNYHIFSVPALVFPQISDLIKTQPHMQSHPSLLLSPLLQIESDLSGFKDVPSKVVIGLVETFCGALLLIIPHPLTRAAGTYLMEVILLHRPI